MDTVHFINGTLLYLGLVVDEHLRWKTDIVSISDADKNIVSFQKVTTNHFYIMKNILFLVESVLNYGILNWGSAAKSYIQKLNFI